ncbi:phosphotransferase family protein [Nocardioides phosphati]|uniref:phosphotransferase family protein n=1 Tax=Nocardioides phosphati TaxID=1867775 RepID=UPI001E587358|nr:phosphotransferase family protein [Nocardioides phosphati]
MTTTKKPQLVVHGVDLDALTRWMDQEGLGSGPVLAAAPVGGGTQNIMLRFVRGGRSFILRRGPEHLRPGSNAVIARETRVLRALAGTDVPHARLIAACTDPAVLGDAAFYLMEPVDGFNAGLELPAAAAGTPALRRELAFSFVDALAALGRVDHVAVGLADFGKPDGFLDRQTGRWLGELNTHLALPGYHRVEVPYVDEVAGWLSARVPTDWQPGLIHGDFHACNVMFRRDVPAVAAVVDWEMATIGDPLLDLGWLVATWDLPGAPDEFAGLLTRAGGLPTADELVARYAAQSDRDLTHLDWYVVLACFKLGIILEGSHARALSGLAPPEIGNRLHTTATRLFERAHTILDGAS